MACLINFLLIGNMNEKKDSHVIFYNLNFEWHKCVRIIVKCLRNIVQAMLGCTFLGFKKNIFFATDSHVTCVLANRFSVLQKRKQTLCFNSVK